MTKIDVGINYPWGQYGWDFGAPPAPPAWGNRRPWAQTLTADLRLFQQLHIFCVRWFILCDGLTYGHGPAFSPHPDIDPRRSGQWRFDDPPPLTSAFLDDFASLLDHFRRARIKLLPSLVDFHLCYPGTDKDSQGNQLPAGFIKCGRSDIIVDPSKREKFFDRVLRPLLNISVRYRNVIHAWELINEPEWVTQGSGVRGKFEPTVPLNKMLAFIREGTKRINAHGFRSTVGYARYGSVLEWEQRCRKEFGKGLDITLHQFHYYADEQRFLLFFKRKAKIPLHAFDPQWPCFIGEFATALHEPWPELKTQDVFSRLTLIENKGFPSAFVWSARGQDPATDWSSSIQQMVKRY